jgi:hypothetical protein
MIKKSALVALVVAISLVFAVPAFAAGPNFGEVIFADDATYGTKGTTDLPAPTENNRQSFDGLFKITGGVTGQLAVAEAAPGNPAYNGGRWIEYSVVFVGNPELVTSYAQLHALEMAEQVTIVETGAYFQCPLLPVK